MRKTIKIDIVSAESEVFSGEAEIVFATGTLGELGIAPGHTPLLTSLKPGQIRVVNQGEEELFYVSGGMIEVQPYVVTILADTIVRAADLDEAAALESRQKAEQAMHERTADFDYSAAITELARSIAQLRTIKDIKKRLKVD